MRKGKARQQGDMSSFIAENPASSKTGSRKRKKEEKKKDKKRRKKNSKGLLFISSKLKI